MSLHAEWGSLQWVILTYNRKQQCSGSVDMPACVAAHHRHGVFSAFISDISFMFVNVCLKCNQKTLTFPFFILILNYKKLQILV